MIDFLKKKNKEETASKEDSLSAEEIKTPTNDDLPAPPKPVHQEGVSLPTISEELPKTQEKPVIGQKPAQPILERSSEVKIQENPHLEPLKQELNQDTKNQEMQLQDIPKKPGLEVKKPAAIPDEPIDPRDRLDDLIGDQKNLETKETSETEIPKTQTLAQEVVKAKEAVNEEDFRLPSSDKLKQKLENKEFFAKHLEVPSEDVNQELQVQTQTIPEPVQEFELPKFSTEEIPNAEKNLATDLPPKLDFAIYVSINDYAYAKNQLKKMHRFFTSADKELTRWERPEKDRILKSMFVELDEVQEKIMQIDEKFFEGGI